MIGKMEEIDEMERIKFNLSKECIDKLATLYHYTGIEEAKNILEKKKISGDNGVHANFFCGNIAHDVELAKKDDVRLQYRWEGRQCEFSGVDYPLGILDPEYTVVKEKMLVHIFKSPKAIGEGDCTDRKYWQSILYSGSTGLIFEGIQFKYGNAPTNPEYLSFSDYKMKLKDEAITLNYRPFLTYLSRRKNFKEESGRIEELTKKIRKLNCIAKNIIYKKFSVPEM